MSAPKLSFIVLSYNYEHFIRQTIESILAQTVKDLEIIVVDDCSTDKSRDVIRSYDDPRIRLIENERNLGGAGSYNVAVSAARGEWLVNLDADDWIDPKKSELQLAKSLLDPSLDVIGTWVKVVDGTGARHTRADEIEAIVNRPYRLNLTETWIGQNPLCRSSTMVRREAHMRFGLDDADMIRAPDFELWTRALAHGARFDLMPLQLTYMRQHARGVTHGDPVGTLLEMSFALIRSLAPLTESRSTFDNQAEIVRWIAKSPHLISLTPLESLRLLGSAVLLTRFDSYKAFRAFIADTSQDPVLERVGRQALISAGTYTPPGTIEKLYSDIGAFVEARDYWKAQHDSVLSSLEKAIADLPKIIEARDHWKSLTEGAHTKIDALQSQIKSMADGRDYWLARAGHLASSAAVLNAELRSTAGTAPPSDQSANVVQIGPHDEHVSRINRAYAQWVATNADVLQEFEQAKLNNDTAASKAKSVLRRVKRLLGSWR